MKRKKKEAPTATESGGLLLSRSSTATAGTEEDEGDDDEVVAPPPVAAPVVLKKSSTTSALEKQWTSEAKKYDPNATIITSLEVACAMTHQLLKAASAPRTMTHIHSELKGVVPAPLLKRTVDQMVEKVSYAHVIAIFLNSRTYT